MKENQYKRKIIWALTVAAFAFLGWQVFSLMADREGKISTQPATEQQALPGDEASASAAQAQAEMAGEGRTQMVHHANLPASVASPASSNMEGNLYLQLSKRYELAKMQRALVQEQAAIAAAKQSIARARQSIVKLNAKGANSAAATVRELVVQPIDAEGYALAYVDYQKGRWTAALEKSGMLNTVVVGSTLPDGNRVIAISQHEVVLQNGANEDRVTFAGAVPVTPQIIDTPASSKVVSAKGKPRGQHRRLAASSLPAGAMSAAHTVIRVTPVAQAKPAAHVHPVNAED